MKILKLRLGVKTRLLQLFFLIGSIAGLLTFEIPWFLATLLAYVFFETVAGNVALHRYFGHGSFKTSLIKDRMLLVLATIIGVGSTVSWVGQHAYHHRHSDTEADVHSPYFQGITKILFGLWDVQIKKKDILHLMRDPWHMFFHNYYFWIHVGYVTVLSAISYKSVLYLYCLPNLMCLCAGYVLAILTHKHGYQTYNTGDFSTNSWIANILTLGEGWHNNHHKFPLRVRQGETSYQWDLPAFVIEHFFVKKI